MRLDPDQLEWIVREVVRRLRDGSASPVEQGRMSGDVVAPPHDSHITLTQSLITAATLEHKLSGVTQLTISRRAVITPAARDLLKERNIELQRQA